MATFSGPACCAPIEAPPVASSARVNINMIRREKSERIWPDSPEEPIVQMPHQSTGRLRRIESSRRFKVEIACKPEPSQLRQSHHGDGNDSLSMPLLWISYSGHAQCAGALSGLLVGRRWPGRPRCTRDSQHCKWRYQPRRGPKTLLQVRCITPKVCTLCAQTRGLRAVTYRPRCKQPNTPDQAV